MRRRSTAPRRTVRHDGTIATKHTVQRSCNGCGVTLGDATREELEKALAGQHLPDVRGECPRCTPPQPEAVAERTVDLVTGAEEVITP